jgi:universal stress protein F
MHKTIVLPIDLSDERTTAATLSAALDLLQENGTLHVVSVMPNFGYAQISGYFGPDFEENALQKLGRDLTEWSQNHIPTDIDVKIHVMHGTVYHEVLEAAQRLAADLIVIGAHRPEFKDYLLGSNASRIVSHAKQSVYIVRS